MWGATCWEAGCDLFRAVFQERVGLLIMWGARKARRHVLLPSEQGSWELPAWSSGRRGLCVWGGITDGLACVVGRWWIFGRSVSVRRAENRGLTVCLGVSRADLRGTLNPEIFVFCSHWRIAGGWAVSSARMVGCAGGGGGLGRVGGGTSREWVGFEGGYQRERYRRGGWLG